MGRNKLVPVAQHEAIAPKTRDVAVQRTWRMWPYLSSTSSSLGYAAEKALETARFQSIAWLAVSMLAGISTWFALKSALAWIVALSIALLLACAGRLIGRGDVDRHHSRSALISMALIFAFGLSLVWIRSELIGAEPIERPRVERLEGYVLEREDQPARDRSRLTLAVQDSRSREPIKVRVNLPLLAPADYPKEGATVRLQARLMPPAAPMLPGGYDFARTAWFDGLSATGSSLGEIEVVEQVSRADFLASLQRQLSNRVRSQIDGSSGGIAAALASGDRGSIAPPDQIAMRDAGLSHLLAISGLHVSAVIASAYLITLKLLAFVPFLALRLKLPLVAAVVGAAAGIGYTLLTGAEVPTVRSCMAAMLVLLALSLGREPISLRMVGFAAIFVMLLWPEAVVGPSFQMSFAAVTAIVALHTSRSIKAFIAHRDEPWLRRVSRNIVMLFVTGMVIEIALMPIVLFHFHRAGLYGAVANVFAIPLVTFLAMPLLAIGLLLDLVGLGGPVFWLAGKSLDLLLAIAHFTAAQPGSVKLMPQTSLGSVLLFVAGGLWLALWQGRLRLFGLVPLVFAAGLLALTEPPDVLISRDGRHVGVRLENGELLTLQTSLSDYATANLLEHAGVSSIPIPMEQWPGARCSPEFCTLLLINQDRSFTLLLARNRAQVEERALAAACEKADIVVAERWLPRSCRPRWLKADRRMLSETGGLAIYLDQVQVQSVSDSQGDHGWWRPHRFAKREARRQKESAAPSNDSTAPIPSHFKGQW